MSDIVQKAPTFFELYSEGRVAAEAIEDFIDAWHETGDEEQRPLSEYLGMTEDEFSVWVLTRRALPIILTARRTSRPLAELVAQFFMDLQAAADPNDASVLYTMRHWLQQHPPA